MNLPVLGHQRPFDAADVGVAEHIESGAPEPAHRAQDPERGLEPLPEGDLPVHAERPQQRRVQLPGEARALAEPLPDLVPDAQGQPGDFVLVFVGEELVQVRRDRLGERGRTWHGGSLGRPRALDVGEVGGGVGLVLVGGQLGRPGSRPGGPAPTRRLRRARAPPGPGRCPSSG